MFVLFLESKYSINIPPRGSKHPPFYNVKSLTTRLTHNLDDRVIFDQGFLPIDDPASLIARQQQPRCTLAMGPYRVLTPVSDEPWFFNDVVIPLVCVLGGGEVLF